MPAPVDLLKPGTWPLPVRFAVPIAGVALLVVLFLYPSPSAPAVRSLLAASEPVAADPAVVRARVERNRLSSTSDAEDLQVTVQNTGTAPLTNLKLQLVAPGFTVQRDGDSLPVHSAGFPDPPAALAFGEDYTFHVRVQPAALSGSYGMTAVVSWKRSTAVPALGAPASSPGIKPTVSEAASGGRTLFLGPVLFDGSLGSARFGRLGQRLASALKDLTLPVLLLLLTNYFTRRQDDRAKTDRKAQEARDKADRDAQDVREKADRNAQTERAEQQQVRELLLGRVMDYAEQAYLPMLSAASGAVDECDALCRGAGGDPLLAVYFLLKLQIVFDRQRKGKGGIFLKSLEAERIVTAAWVVGRVAIRAVWTPDDVQAASVKAGLLEDFATFRTLDPVIFQGAVDRLQAWISREPAGAFDRHGPMEGFLGAVDVLQAVLRYETNRPLMKYWYEEEPMWDFRLPRSVLPATRTYRGRLQCTWSSCARRCRHTADGSSKCLFEKAKTPLRLSGSPGFQCHDSSSRSKVLLSSMPFKPN